MGTYIGAEFNGYGTQAVYISQTVTIRGGYTTTNWTTPYPLTQTTILDADGLGRVVYVDGYGVPGEIAPVLEGLHLTNGSSTANGGGVYGFWAHGAAIRNCRVYGNTAATNGGGIELTDSNNVSLTHSHIYDNTAGDAGGGAILNGENIVFADNQVYGNLAGGNGGGINAHGEHNHLLRNDVYSNTSDNEGGGIHLQVSYTTTVAGNHVYSNTAARGGGIVAYQSHGSSLTGNSVISNTAADYSAGGIYVSWANGVTLESNLILRNAAHDTSADGGGIHVGSSSDVMLRNNIVAENWISGSNGDGAGICISGSTAHLLHTTLARNANAQGIYANGSSIWLTNTILVSHTVGIELEGSGSASLYRTLWGGSGTWSNGSDTVGSGITHSSDYYVDPGFARPEKGDYHITASSPARDLAVDGEAHDDIDGDPRPFCGGTDLGADEVSCCAYLASCCGRLSEPPYFQTVQAAVDASNSASDVVQVTGYCRGVETRGSWTQVAYVTKTLTIRGGYSPDFTSRNPQAYPTTLDAVGQGRVVHLVGESSAHIVPTLETLRITGGAPTSSGGGIAASYADAIINDCQIYGNTSTYYSSNSGGGVFLSTSHATLNRNTVSNNTTGYRGAGIFAQYSNIALNDNTVLGNTGSGGNSQGGGIFLSYGDAELVNTVIADNQVQHSGSGVYSFAASPRFVHTTISGNSGGDGSGIYIAHQGLNYVTVELTNTILVSQTIGIYVTANDTAILEATLWGDGDWANDANWSGSVSSLLDVTGLPGFVDPAVGDYHIGPASDARDQGVSTAVLRDIDGEPRIGSPDLGADEYALQVYLPLVLRNYEPDPN
jgi:parallel beta-helix repeat protein